MFEMEIDSCVDFVVSGIDSGEDTGTLEETLSEIKELQEKLDNSVQELLVISPSEDAADTLCFHFSKLKFRIRKTTAVLRKNKKETQSSERSNISSGNLRVTFDSSSSNPTVLNTNRTSRFFSASAGSEVLGQIVSSDSAAPASSDQANSISPPANEESNIVTSTATSSGNPVHSTFSSEPFLADSNNSFSQLVHIILCFEQQSIMEIPSKSTILRSVGVRYTWLCLISEPHLHVHLFPKICAQVAGNKIWWQSGWLDEVVQHFLSHNISFADVITWKDDKSSIAINWRGTIFKRWIQLQR